MVWHLECHRFSATALIVGDGCATCGTGGGLLASCAVPHIKNKIHVSIERD